MFITGLGTAVPPQRYTQRECWDALRTAPPFATLASRSQSILKKVLCGDNGIEARHLSLDSLTEVFNLTPNALHSRFATHAPALAAEAARRALDDAGLSVKDMDAVIISTCTGYLCPGLTSHVSERLGLRTNALCLDLVGQGCGAAIPNMRTGDALLASGQCRHVLSICVEVCSAAFYIDDDPGVLISACLFGDGAGAAVLSATPIPNKRQIKWLTSDTTLQPHYRDLLRFEQQDGMLRNILTPQVPTVAAEAASHVFDQVLARSGVNRGDIRAWIWHAGGRDVLAALRETFGLSESDTSHSSAILRDFGNVSSPCLYFVLQSSLAANAQDGLWWMSSFGAGFSCHGALLEISH